MALGWELSDRPSTRGHIPEKDAGPGSTGPPKSARSWQNKDECFLPLLNCSMAAVISDMLTCATQFRHTAHELAGYSSDLDFATTCYAILQVAGVVCAASPRHGINTLAVYRGLFHFRWSWQPLSLYLVIPMRLFGKLLCRIAHSDQRDCPFQEP